MLAPDSLNNSETAYLLGFFPYGFPWKGANIHRAAVLSKRVLLMTEVRGDWSDAKGAKSRLQREAGIKHKALE